MKLGVMARGLQSLLSWLMQNFAVYNFQFNRQRVLLKSGEYHVKDNN